MENVNFEYETAENGITLTQKSLTNITIPDSVTHIGKEAFKNCTLKEISIPTDAQIAETAFTGTPYEMQLSADDLADLEENDLAK